MPLIRYDLEDLAVLSGELDDHGVPMIERIEGRNQEIVIATDGTRVSPFAFGYFMRTFRHLEAFQFVQVGPGRYRMKLVVAPAFDAEAEMRAGLLQIVGADADLTFEYPSSLPVPASGKRPYVVQAWQGAAGASGQ
jgi:phenylacetate-CoA ligase